MKKSPVESLEKEPLAVGAKLLEMKGVKEAADRGVRAGRKKNELAGKNIAMKRSKELVNSAGEPIPLKIKKTHCLGDFYGKFHPSKSTKGIKRSE